MEKINPAAKLLLANLLASRGHSFPITNSQIHPAV